MAKKDKKAEQVKPPEPSALERELASLDPTKRAAVLMLALGEQQASDIIGYLNRDEVETLGTAMVSVNDVSQTAVDKVLDQFIGELRGQTNLGLGSEDYVEGVLKRALGPEKSASVLSRILPSSSSKGLEILAWMAPQNIFEMCHEVLNRIDLTNECIMLIDVSISSFLASLGLNYSDETT